MSGTGASSPGHRLALSVDFQLEEYRIVNVLGQGGFGITYLAYDTRLATEVAIKEMLPKDYATRIDGFEVAPKRQSDERTFAGAKQRFIEEARMLARLSHPNIVRVFRFLECHGTAYMVMDFVRGQSFTEWMRMHRKPTEKELTDILMPLLNGLDYVHQQRVLHRDISPDNILITEQGRPMLLDFGNSRTTVDPDRNLTDVVRPGYSPIEQYQTVTPQGSYTDLYALAGVMIHAITGKSPPLSMDRLGRSDPFEPLTPRFRDRYRESFLRALDAAFAVQPEDRLQSAAEWRKMLAGDFRGPRRKQKRVPPLERPEYPGVGAKRKAPVSSPKSRTPLKLLALFLIALMGGGTGLYFWVGNESNIQQSPRPVPLPTALAVTPEVATRERPYVNSLGMEFVPVQETNVLFCVHQTRNRDYAAYARAHHEIPVKNEWENSRWGEGNVAVSSGDDNPVVMVSWDDAIAFCEWLSETESKHEGYFLSYRLPTQQEWSAAVGSTIFPWGDAWPPPRPVGNYADRTAQERFGSDIINPIPGYQDGFATTSPVKSFPPNRLGLYDLGSNIQEWCRDKTDDGKVGRRGASWKDSTKDALASMRKDDSPPNQRSVFIGFRCVLELTNQRSNK